MFNGEWLRIQHDTPEQLLKVLGWDENIGGDKSVTSLTEKAMEATLRNYLNARLTTTISEDDDDVRIERRFLFENEDELEEQKTSFKLGDQREKIRINDETVEGAFKLVNNGLEIVGKEKNVDVRYHLQEGKLVEVLSRKGFNFKQVSREIPHTKVLFI